MIILCPRNINKSNIYYVTNGPPKIVNFVYRYIYKYIFYSAPIHTYGKTYLKLISPTVSYFVTYTYYELGKDISFSKTIMLVYKKRLISFCSFHKQYLKQIFHYENWTQQSITILFLSQTSLVYRMVENLTCLFSGSSVYFSVR